VNVCVRESVGVSAWVFSSVRVFFGVIVCAGLYVCGCGCDSMSAHVCVRACVCVHMCLCLCVSL